MPCTKKDCKDNSHPEHQHEHEVDHKEGCHGHSHAEHKHEHVHEENHEKKGCQGHSHAEHKHEHGHEENHEKKICHSGHKHEHDSEGCHSPARSSTCADKSCEDHCHSGHEHEHEHEENHDKKGCHGHSHAGHKHEHGYGHGESHEKKGCHGHSHAGHKHEHKVEEKPASCAGKKCCKGKPVVQKVVEENIATKKSACAGKGCCKGGPSVMQDIKEDQIELTMKENAEKLIFKIEGMCCAAEIDVLKQALNPITRGKEANLAFDLINGKLILESKSMPSKEQVIKLIARTGMTATLWEDHLKTENTTFWKKHGPIIMNIISLLTLIAGLTIQWVKDGASAAFGGGVGGEEDHRPDDPPVATIVVYSISVLTGGYLIIPKALKAVRRLRPDPNFLMTLATCGAIAMNHWFEAASSMYLFSLAGLVENWNMARARKAIRKLMELAPSTAQVVGEDGSISEQPVEQVPVDAIITIRPGEKIPMDSILVAGSTSVNQAPITGESMPVQKEVGDTLFAGTINGDGSIQCKVTKAASDSTLANIIRKVEEAQSNRAQSEQWIERLCLYYVPAIMVASVIVAIVPPLASKDRSDSETWYPWVYKGLQVLVISCPCSLVVSTPVSIVAGLTTAARNGVLIKGGVYLEMAAYIKAFAMDKTGTLTNGEPVVQHIVPLSGLTEEAFMKLAAALEIHSDHPLARAIQRRAKSDNIQYQPAEDFKVFKGKGGEGTINGEVFWIGSHRFLHEKVGENEPKEIHEKIEELESAGHSIVAIGQDLKICGLISIADSIRKETKSAVQAMKKVGVKKVVMLTGDNKGAAKTIAESIGIDEFRAELLPEDKVKNVKDLVDTYKKVAMVGDGINDAPAMATASLGVAMGAAGSDAAIETADIALMSDDLEKLAWLVKHARNTLFIIQQNVVFSILVKATFAGLIFSNKSSLWLAMLGDVGATFVVVSNALRLVKSKSPSKKNKETEKVSAPAKEKMLTATTKQSSVLEIGSVSSVNPKEPIVSAKEVKETVLKIEEPSLTVPKKKCCGGKCH